MDVARRRGMQFEGPPTIHQFPTGSQWGQTFNDFASKDVQFVILIDHKSMDTHGGLGKSVFIYPIFAGILKYYEVRTKILTQHITYEVVLRVPSII